MMQKILKFKESFKISLKLKIFFSFDTAVTTHTIWEGYFFAVDNLDQSVSCGWSRSISPTGSVMTGVNPHCFPCLPTLSFLMLQHLEWGGQGQVNILEQQISLRQGVLGMLTMLSGQTIVTVGMLNVCILHLSLDRNSILQSQVIITLHIIS